MKISIIFPTRTRTGFVEELIKSAQQTADNFSYLEFCIYYDLDDNETKDYIAEASSRYQNVKYTTSNDSLNLSEMWNYAYSTLATGDIIMHCGDDIRFRTKSWDTIVINKFKESRDKILLVYGNDGIQKSNLATHSFIHRKWIEVSGFWLPPYFTSDYNDTWLDNVASRINRRVYLGDVYTEHLHYTVGKTEIDDNTRRRLNRHEKENPLAIYNSKESERVIHANKLQTYIQNFTAKL
jgi:hypothetical protein